MSSLINNGGPAFPRGTKWALDGSICQKGSVGMTLRDWFAGLAMQSQVMTDMVPGAACDALVNAAIDAEECPAFRLAKNSYSIADAMLAARKEAA